MMMSECALSHFGGSDDNGGVGGMKTDSNGGAIAIQKGIGSQSIIG